MSHGMSHDRGSGAFPRPASFLLAACSTMEGFGRDVQSGGKKIEREAQEHK